MRSYQRGSEWRRWELHMHTPGTLKNDQFRGENSEEKWNEFYNDINSYIGDGSDVKRKIAVLAITDYISIKNYLKVKHDNKLPNTIEFILPNVELRMTPVSTQAPINIHCLFNPDIDNELEERFFGKLCFDYGGSLFSAKESELIRLGKTLTNNPSLYSNDAYKVGAEQFIISKNNLDKIFRDDRKLRENTVIIVSNSSNDGVTGITRHSDYFTVIDGRNGSQLDATRQSIYQCVDGIFSSSDKDRLYFSGNGPDDKDTVIRKCGSLKPCYHGCDAHINEKIFKPYDNKFCWIKADPTFQGLKQTFFEPIERVFIGEMPDILNRTSSNSTKYISSLSIEKINNKGLNQDIWFGNNEIPLNSGLVAIIGNKGSGKSAIADIIGLCGDSEHYEDFTFLTKHKFLKKGLADQFSAKLIFISGTETQEKNLMMSVEVSNDRKVQYLPQNYFETVCNEIGKVESLREEIEKVVFQYIPSEKRYHRLTFDELIRFKSDSINKEINELKVEIYNINLKIIALEDKINPEYKKSIENKLLTKKEELRIHMKKKPEKVELITCDENSNNNIQKKEIAVWMEKLDLAKSQKEIIERQISKALLVKEEILQIKREIEAKVNELYNLIMTKNEICIKHNLNLEEIVSISYDDKKIIGILNEIEETIIQYNVQKGESYIKENIDYDSQTILAKILICENNIKEIESKLSDKEKEYQNYKKDLEKWQVIKKNIEGSVENLDSLKYLEHEIEYLKEQINTDIIDIRKKRIDISIDIYRKKKEIKQIYDDIKQEISEVLAENQDQNLTIDSMFSLDLEFVSNFMGHVNKLKLGLFKGNTEGSNFLKEKLMEPLNIDEEDSIKEFLQKVIIYFENDEGIEGTYERFIGDQILKRREFYNFVFSLDFIVHHYELCQNGKTLEELSPGEKGALLLIFYLVLDKNDIPLIIDQPEDNLDNNSVANVLVPYILKAKSKRQIIMVTHNPNLAIVADAEQIINVDIDKKNKNTFKFVSGSIENLEINKIIVNILEGTMPAFMTRENKYIK